MANFIFNEGATLFLNGGFDWVTDNFVCALVDDSVANPTNATLWGALSGGSPAEQAFANKSITTAGAAAADPVTFTSVSTTLPGGRFTGLVIRKQSDNKLIAWIEDGFSNLQNGLGDLVGVQGPSLTYTFTLIPGVNNENAWFRP